MVALLKWQCAALRILVGANMTPVQMLLFVSPVLGSTYVDSSPTVDMGNMLEIAFDASLIGSPPSIGDSVDAALGSCGAWSAQEYTDTADKKAKMVSASRVFMSNLLRQRRVKARAAEGAA